MAYINSNKFIGIGSGTPLSAVRNCSPNKHHRGILHLRAIYLKTTSGNFFSLFFVVINNAQAFCGIGIGTPLLLSVGHLLQPSSKSHLKKSLLKFLYFIKNPLNFYKSISDI